MDAYAHVPIIILGCPQNLTQTAQIKYVEQELQMIEKLLMRFAVLESFHLVKSWPLNDTSLVEVLDNYRFNPSVKLIHLAGIVHEPYLSPIQDEADLAGYIGHFPYLQTLYISGFAHPDLLEALLNRDIPAIIMTETMQSKQFAREMAHVFYSEIGKGLSLEEALIQVRDNYPQRFVLQPVNYDIEKNVFNWKGKPSHIRQNKVAWGAYALENRADLEWKLPIPTVRSTSDLALGGGQVKQRIIRRIGLAILSLLMLVALVFSLLQVMNGQNWFAN
jgi:hypothetical protein